MTDEPINGRAPQNIREVGFVVDGIRKDVERLDSKMDRYVSQHAAEHVVTNAAVAANTDWRKERQVYEQLMRWVIGTNLAGIVAIILAVVALVLNSR